MSAKNKQYFAQVAEDRFKKGTVEDNLVAIGINMEDVKAKPYLDSVDLLTIGIGYNLEAAYQSGWLKRDLKRAGVSAKEIKEIMDLSETAVNLSKTGDNKSLALKKALVEHSDINLSNKEMEALKDIVGSRIAESAKRTLPHFENYSFAQQSSLMYMAYNGSLNSYLKRINGCRNAEELAEQAKNFIVHAKSDLLPRPTVAAMVGLSDTTQEGYIIQKLYENNGALLDSLAFSAELNRIRKNYNQTRVEKEAIQDSVLVNLNRKLPGQGDDLKTVIESSAEIESKMAKQDKQDKNDQMDLVKKLIELEDPAKNTKNKPENDGFPEIALNFSVGAVFKDISEEFTKNNINKEDHVYQSSGFKI